ncbi:10365_t:CDS:2, partial [Cetraspora pellucida]
EIIESSLPIFIADETKNNEDEISEDETSSIEEPEFALDYKLFIKLLDETSLSAKWFEESVTTIDEFLLSIYNKEAGVDIQLVNAQDFIKFKVKYLKLVARKNDIRIYITIIQLFVSQNKQKKKESNLDDDENNKKSNNVKKINQIPSILSLSLYNKDIAKNVTNIQNAYYYNRHNQSCLNKKNHKNLYVEINFTMFSI